MSERNVWAGIDEAGYGPLLGPLVVAGTAFRLPCSPSEGILWELLDEAVVQTGSSGRDRLMVNDSKEVYSTSRGWRRLEEGVLSFAELAGALPDCAGALLERLAPAERTDGEPWFSGTDGLELPSASNPSAVASKTRDLEMALRTADVALEGMWACVVLPREFNALVQKMGNKSLLLFNRAGRILRTVWSGEEDGDACVLVDRHGGRGRYRTLLRNVYPELPCDIAAEGPERSVYAIGDGPAGLQVAFKKDGDRLALPTALASMIAKYVRELHMKAFNRYWQERAQELKPTAGYGRDAYRFLDDIDEVLREEGVDRDRLVRCR